MPGLSASGCCVGMAAGGIELDALRHPREQSDAQFLLKRLDLLAQRRLLHEQPFGGTRDVLLFSHCDEIT